MLQKNFFYVQVLATVEEEMMRIHIEGWRKKCGNAGKQVHCERKNNYPSSSLGRETNKQANFK
jgi:hypothetical protein